MASGGVFITFEGIDGAGKSTHVSALGELFSSSGRDVVVTREPGGTALAEELRRLVLSQAMDGLTEALLVFAARRDHLQQLIEPALARGSVVLCDRFTDSTFAYQGGGQGLEPALLHTLERWVLGTSFAPEAALRQPDLTLWFDLAPADAAKRLATARSPDRFECRGVEYFERVSGGYRARAAAHPERFVRIDAAMQRPAVWQAVLAAIQSRGWLP